MTSLSLFNALLATDSESGSTSSVPSSSRRSDDSATQQEARKDESEGSTGKARLKCHHDVIVCSRSRTNRSGS